MPHRDSISARNDLFRLAAARRERARSCGEERALDAPRFTSDHGRLWRLG